MVGPSDLPAIAWDALEAGYDGPAIRRMAAFDDPTGFETDAALPAFMKEADLHPLNKQDAACRVGYDKAQAILEDRTDPLPELPFFERLWINNEHPRELGELAMLADADYDYLELNGRRLNIDEIRLYAREQLTCFTKEFEMATVVRDRT